MLVEPWENPGALARAYCIQEVYETQRSRSCFDLAMSATEECAFLTFLAQERGHDYARDIFDRVDVSQATYRNAEEKERIMGFLRLLDGGIEKCNEKVRSLLKSKMENRKLGSEGAKKIAAALEGSRLDSLK
jgi:hypothetical protein